MRQTKIVTWSSSNAAVATVAGGVVTPVAAGAAVITATAVQGSFTATCTVTVTAPVVSPAPAPTTYTVTFNSQGGTAVTAITGIAYNATVTLPTNPTKALNTFAGWNTEAGGGGTLFDGMTHVTASITVYAQWTAAATDNPLIGVVQVGEADVTPTSFTAPISGQTIAWLSSDTGKATINGTTGLIHAVAAGATTISYEVTETSTGRIVAKGSLAVIVAAAVQATPTFSPVVGAVSFGTAVTITSAGADAIYYTTDNSDPTISSTNQATTPLVINAAGTIKALAVKAGSTNSAIGSAAYTQALAIAPSAVVLAVGSTAPVGGVTNVAIPAAGVTDTTGAVTGWVVTTANKIKFTVTDVSPAASAITINLGAYTSGDDYAITAAASLAIVVTTTEAGKETGVRTFTVTVAPLGSTIGDSYQGGIVAYIDGTGHGLIVAKVDQSTGSAWTTGGSTQTTFIGTTHTEIGTGQANTTAIVGQSGFISGAAHDCDAYTNIDYGTGVYTDWYLPSMNELIQLYSNRVKIGGFAQAYYWSSSENNYDTAWTQPFADGYYSTAPAKSATRYVRAVRSFPSSAKLDFTAGTGTKLATVVLTEETTTETGADEAQAMPLSVTIAGADNAAAVFVPVRTDAGATVSAYADNGAGTGAYAAVAANYDFSGTNTTLWIKVVAEDASATLYYELTVTVTLSVGNSWHGGKVAYLLVSGDTLYKKDGTTILYSYNENVQHGLIAATEDQGTGTVNWAVSNLNTPVGTLTTLGSGAANTDKIIVQQNGEVLNNYAAGRARAYKGSGYTDWYLPSQDELNKLYENRVAIGGFVLSVNDGPYYWSSSESTNGVYFQYFDSGNPGDYAKAGLFHVRAVRSF